MEILGELSVRFLTYVNQVLFYKNIYSNWWIVDKAFYASESENAAPTLTMKYKICNKAYNFEILTRRCRYD